MVTFEKMDLLIVNTCSQVSFTHVCQLISVHEPQPPPPSWPAVMLPMSLLFFKLHLLWLKV